MDFDEADAAIAEDLEIEVEEGVQFAVLGEDPYNPFIMTDDHTMINVSKIVSAKRDVLGGSVRVLLEGGIFFDAYNSYAASVWNVLTNFGD